MAGLDIAARFGASVKHFRRRLGISQEGLAERANLHRTYIAGIEGGSRNVTLRSIDKLARALQVPTAMLLNGDSPVSHKPQHSERELVDVLLAEANQQDAELAIEAFKQARFLNPIHVVEDGEQALDFIFCRGKYAHRLQEDGPRVVLLNLTLPKLSGLEVLRRLRENKATRSIPVVMLAASQREMDISECRKLGAESCILKPVDICRLTSVTPVLNLTWGLFSFSTPQS